LPPFDAGTNTVIVLNCQPVPEHDTEHAPNALKLLITQSTGADTVGLGPDVPDVLDPGAPDPGAPDTDADADAAVVGATVAQAGAEHTCCCKYVEGSGHALPPFADGVSTDLVDS